ncbi:MAG: FAD-dependent oxidoreductase, partial [Clostridia bacterium]|nr:FAD-dependent oxidoreductase [Clostridia bacterium]
MKWDVIIIGAGPAGIFTAYESKRLNPEMKILIIEKGLAVEDRACPKSKTHKCVSCRPNCHITTGFSGAGAFSDGKLSLSCEVGGDFPTLIGEDRAQALIDYVDKIYLAFGADEKIEGVGNPDAVKRIRRRAIRAGLRLVDCPIRHMGTERAQQIYYAI